VVIWSVIANNMFFKGDTGNEAVGTVGTLVVVWKVCVRICRMGS
jgi:hypothetical protein